MQLPPAHIILMALGRHHSICDLIETSLPSENKVIVHKLRSELFFMEQDLRFWLVLGGAARQFRVHKFILLFIYFLSRI